MKEDEPKPLTPFEAFAARRIAEFPTLYHSKADVIGQCILGSQGECYWEDGILHQPNQRLRKDKTWGPYPLRMPLATAAQLHQYSAPAVSYDVGNPRAPISKLPDDIEESFLKEIDLYLFTWESLTEELWMALAVARCIVLWRIPQNPHANEPERTLADYLKFVKLIPGWRAKIRTIEYYQQHGQIEAATFLGINI